MGKKVRPKVATLKDFGAVPEGFPDWELELYMSRVGEATADRKEFKRLVVEGAEMFGPSFMLYLSLAKRFAFGLERARDRATMIIDENFNTIVREVLLMEIEQDTDKLASYVAPKQFPKEPKHLYLVRAENGFHKIGITQDLSTRVGALQTSGPHRVDLIHSILHEEADNLERHLHKKFADRRVNGEWFHLEDEDVQYIKSLDPGTEKTCAPK